MNAKKMQIYAKKNLHETIGILCSTMYTVHIFE